MGIGMEIKDIKNKYNYWLGRYLNAEKWLMKSNSEEIEKYIDEFHKIVKELSLLIQEFRKVAKRDMTKEEMYEGFKE